MEKLSNPNTLKKDNNESENSDRFFSARQALSRFALIGSDPEYQESVEQDRVEIISSITGYVLASNALNYFIENRQNLNTSDVLRLLQIEDSENDDSKTDKNSILFRSYMNYMSRIERCDDSERGDITNRDFTRLKDILKTEYIMKLNGQIVDFIDSTNKNNNQIGKLKSTLARLYMSVNKKLYDAGYIKSDLSRMKRADQDELKNIFEIIEGMRHEAAFKELILEMNDESIDFLETNDYADSHGIDMILDVKLSNKLNGNGQRIIATKTEIDSNNFTEVYLPIDIKSTERAAELALEKQANYSDHWVMWSHVYREDFRLTFSNNRASLGFREDEAPIFLSVSEQIKAMQDLDSAGIYYEGQDGGFTPPNMKKRLFFIKKEILNAVNTMRANGVDLRVKPNGLLSA